MKKEYNKHQVRNYEHQYLRNNKTNKYDELIKNTIKVTSKILKKAP